MDEDNIVKIICERCHGQRTFTKNPIQLGHIKKVSFLGKVSEIPIVAKCAYICPKCGKIELNARD